MTVPGLDIEWVDLGREPECAPNPAFPDGIDVDISSEDAPACFTELPHPAKRCGFYKVTCGGCGLSVIVTTAGRSDDPRSLRVTCKIRGTKQ